MPLIASLAVTAAHGSRHRREKLRKDRGTDSTSNEPSTPPDPPATTVSAFAYMAGISTPIELTASEGWVRGTGVARLNYRQLSHIEFVVKNAAVIDYGAIGTPVDPRIFGRNFYLSFYPSLPAGYFYNQVSATSYLQKGWRWSLRYNNVNYKYPYRAYYVRWTNLAIGTVAGSTEAEARYRLTDVSAYNSSAWNENSQRAAIFAQQDSAALAKYRLSATYMNRHYSLYRHAQLGSWLVKRHFYAFGYRYNRPYPWNWMFHHPAFPETKFMLGVY